jgi:hypothetical protein
MTIDTSRTIEIEGSPLKLIALFACSPLMRVASAAVAFQWIPVARAGAQFVGYVVLLLSGMGSVGLLWRAFSTAGPVVTIAPEGIRDKRLATEFIPWNAVRWIGTWQSQVMVLNVAPVFESRLTLSAIARWSRGLNRAIGADGLCITAQGLKIDYDTLLTTATAYAQEAQRRAAC